MERCARCGAPLAGHGGWRCLPLGRALGLIGGLGALAAYFMPWFGTQGALFTGALLFEFLGNAALLRQVMPALVGQAPALRALVVLFPVAGGLVVVLAVLMLVQPATARVAGVLMALIGLVLLVALGGGILQLPAGSNLEVGLYVLGLAGVVMIVAGWLDRFAIRA